MKLYFRRRKQGAFAFRLDVENRQRRLEMVQVATINGKWEIRPHKKNPPTDAELAEIEKWVATHRDGSELLPVEEAIAEINLLTQWIVKDATDDEVLSWSDPVLLAVHDLRYEIVRRLAKVGQDRKPGLVRGEPNRPDRNGADKAAPDQPGPAPANDPSRRREPEG